MIQINRTKEEIGNRIKSERKLLKLTQIKLAEELDRERALIGRWERGERLPSLDDLINMCNLFNCEVSYLLCEKTENTIKKNKEEIESLERELENFKNETRRSLELLKQVLSELLEEM